MVASYVANALLRNEKTGKSGRNDRICRGTTIMDNVGISRLRSSSFRAPHTNEI
jgi:hypothetical protein